ncbi:hypothetical protein T8T21_02270 [Limimaricola variabilis]|uniref:hypothetical protein n=1 Tax=Limimaricola variabilis TaxID=1492771 RepID=UPI002AC9536F|nr:hypothetical protein [Limimaricola variabilis]WPY94970.1 hypothetical protein T8T21_02270 [Limimaricola variabilis]
MDPKRDPARRCRKLPDRPEADRRAWEATVTPGGLLDECRLAGRWRPATRKSVQDAYGRWLTFLDRNRWLGEGSAPVERLTPNRLRGFIVELQPTVAPLTLRAEHGAVARPLWRAALYRDGLMILMLTCRPLRRSNLAGLRLGRHIVKRDNSYVLLLEESETKNHRCFEQALPEALTPAIERYLAQYRPLLIGQGEDDHLWISGRGAPLAETGVYACVMARTRAAFGIGIPPHRFRDCAVTSLGEIDPELVWLAPALLHHADRRIAEMHYDQARDTTAVSLWQRHLQDRRRSARAAAVERGRLNRAAADLQQTP